MSQNDEQGQLKVENNGEGIDGGGQQGGHREFSGGHHGGGRGRGGGRFGRGRGRGGGGGEGGGRFDDRRRPRDGERNEGGGGRGAAMERIMMDKLKQLQGPTYELPPLEATEKKFCGRSRLYVGNIAADVSEDDIKDLFNKYGETSELFINKDKFFAFICMDYHYNAERAKQEINGKELKGRPLRVRFAPNGSIIKVKNLDEFVTNELLQHAFSIFGDVDRAVVIVDDRGKSIGEGIVEFSRKTAAQFALRKCAEACFFLTQNLRPVLVEMYEPQDDIDGYPDKIAQKKQSEFYKYRSVGPRFAAPDSFEHEYGIRWKQLFERHAQKQDDLKKELELDQQKLMAQMEYARYEHETAMLREELRAREMDMDRQKREWEMKSRQVEEARQRQEELMRRQEEQMQEHMLRQEEEMRRRQEENNLFRQAHQLTNMLDQQEQEYEHGDRKFNNDDGVMDPKSFLNSYDRNNRFDRHPMDQGMRQQDDRGAVWGGGENRGPRDNFNPKRRRY